MNIAIIPARKNSRRVKNKNLRKLNGKPLIEYTIKSALESKLNQIYISTDSEEIIEISKKFDVNFIRRPYKLATDNITLFEVIKDFSLGLKQKLDNCNVFLLQPTCPFRPKNLINDAIKLFKQTKCDSVTSYRRVLFYHPNRMKKIKDGIVNFYFEKEIENKQPSLLPVAYQRDGYLYSFNLDVIIEQNSLFGKNQRAVIIEDNEIINIDNELDWIKAENYARINEV